MPVCKVGSFVCSTLLYTYLTTVSKSLTIHENSKGPNIMSRRRFLHVRTENWACAFRDRENSTISVTGLAKDTNEESIARLFRDVSVIQKRKQAVLTLSLARLKCGNIREIKFKILNDQAVATVEFDNRVSFAHEQVLKQFEHDYLFLAGEHPSCSY